jgi:hypothetical protein
MVRALKAQAPHQARHTKTSLLWYHSIVVNARIVLKSQQFESKHDSELKVVQTILEVLNLEGVVFTMDALHCQKKLLG